MPIELDDVEPELAEAQEAFRLGGQDLEEGLTTSDAGLLQLRKACRLLSGADRLVADGYFTLAIEASFTSIEKTLVFRLIHDGHHDPSRPPQSHTTAIERSAEVGFLSDEVASRLVNLWRTNRAQTYYQDAIATRERAERLVELGTSIHEHIVNLARIRHECVCE